jgi:translation initiation factor IF-3
MLYSVCVRAPARERRQSPEAGNGDFWRSTIALDKRSAKSFIRINDRIRAREIRVIDENSEQLGIMAPFEALKIARERGLDLVEVSPNAVPPVCRIQDYGR